MDDRTSVRERLREGEHICKDGGVRLEDTLVDPDSTPEATSEIVPSANQNSSSFFHSMCGSPGLAVVAEGISSSTSIRVSFGMVYEGSTLWETGC